MDFFLTGTGASCVPGKLCGIAFSMTKKEEKCKANRPLIEQDDKLQYYSAAQWIKKILARENGEQKKAVTCRASASQLQ